MKVQISSKHLKLLELHIITHFIFFCSASSHKSKIRDSHRRIMLLNHPDRGIDMLFEWKGYLIKD